MPTPIPPKWFIFLLSLSSVATCPARAQGESHAPASADYIVYESENTICAERVSSGETILRSQDAAQVIQQTIDSLPVTGGKIYIGAGAYELTTTIRIKDKHAVHLEGAARGIVFSGGKEGTVLRSKLPINLIEIFGEKIKMAGITISNLHLIGSGKQNGKAGIWVRGGSDLLSLHQVGANHCGIGFHFEGGHVRGAGVIDAAQIQFCDPQVNGIGLKIERSHYAKIVGGEFSDCDHYGIMISAPDSGHARTQGIKISAVTGVRNGKAGILIGQNTDCITVTGGSDFGGTKQGSGVVISDEDTGHAPRNIIVSSVHSYNNKYAGILVDKAEHVLVSACIYSVHRHASVGNAGQQYGIHIKTGSKDVVLQGNITYGNAKQGIMDDSAKALVANNSDSPVAEKEE
jgi:hypothetical protein